MCICGGYLLNSHKSKGYLLIVPMVLLCLWGIVMVGSANGWVYQSDSFYIDPLMIRQFIGFLIGLCMIIAIQYCSYDLLKLAAVPLYLGSLVLLVLVLFYGTGAEEGDEVHRWLYVATDISVQPSEIAKVAQILLFATLFDRLRSKIDRFWLLIILVVLALVP